jgi:hypothetical protein
MTSDQVWSNFEKSMEAEALAAEGDSRPPTEQMPPVAAPPEEKPKPAEERRYPLEEEQIQEAPLPRRAREALKDVRDPRWQKIFTDAYWYAEAYRKAGMKVSDIPRYRDIAPTYETLETINQIAREKAEFDNVLSTGTPESVTQLANYVNNANPQMWGKLVSQIAENLPSIDKKAYYALGDRIVKNAIANMRKASQEKDNEDLSTAADVISEWLGIDTSKKDGPVAPQLPPEIQQELAEAKELKRQEEQRRYEWAQDTYTGFLNSTYETAKAEGITPIQEWVNTWGASLPSDAAREELLGRIGNRILQAIQSNPNVGTTFQKLIHSGDGGEAHKQACARYLVNQAKALLPQVAPDEFKKFSALFGGQAKKQRDEKIAAATARRDVGSAGIASAPGVATISGRDKKQDQVWAEFEKARGLE